MKCRLSRQALARAVGVSHATLCRWERGEAAPNLISLGRFTKFCEEQGIHFEETNSDRCEAEEAGQHELPAELEALRYYEKAYEALSSSVMYGVCKYRADEQLSIVFANDIFYQLHGFDSQEKAEAAGFTNVLYAIPPYGREMVLAAHAGYSEGKTKKLFETEYPSVDVDGKRIWVLCRGVYSPKEGLFSSSVLDITDRKKAEEQLRMSEERYQLALSHGGREFFCFDVPTRTVQLSQKLADTFGLPLEVENMPGYFIEQGLVEKESEDDYRHFYDRIIAGEASGETIISSHMRQTPEKVLWFKMAFTTIFDNSGAPSSSIITYEDINEQYNAELSSKWKQYNLSLTDNERYALVVYDLNRDGLLSQSGLVSDGPLADNCPFDHILDYAMAHCIHEDDKEALRAFLSRERLLQEFDEDKTEGWIEYRSKLHGESFKWNELSYQMVRDEYSGHAMVRLLFLDIHEKKSGEIKMRQSMDALKKELENSRIKIMINQMQPHFLNNALSAIQTLVKVDPDYAYQLIYDFTMLFRSSIKALSSDELISFEDELDNVKAYFNIVKMRFGDKMKVVYDIKSKDFSVIPLALQPLAENAVRHGLYPKGKAGGTIYIRSYETPEENIVEIEDNGKGFNVHEALEQNSDSMGIKNLIFRLKLLLNAELLIKSEINKGTFVKIMIPKKQEGAKPEGNDNY